MRYRVKNAWLSLSRLNDPSKFTFGQPTSGRFTLSGYGAGPLIDLMRSLAFGDRTGVVFVFVRFKLLLWACCAVSFLSVEPARAIPNSAGVPQAVRSHGLTEKSTLTLIGFRRGRYKRGYPSYYRSRRAWRRWRRRGSKVRLWFAQPPAYRPPYRESRRCAWARRQFYRTGSDYWYRRSILCGTQYDYRP